MRIYEGVNEEIHLIRDETEIECIIYDEAEISASCILAQELRLDKRNDEVLTANNQWIKEVSGITNPRTKE